MNSDYLTQKFAMHQCTESARLTWPDWVRPQPGQSGIWEYFEGDPKKGHWVPLPPSFEFASLKARCRDPRRRDSLLAQAVGLRRRDRAGASLTLADGTAGWGMDAYLLAALGASVLLFEKDAWLAQLLTQQLKGGLGDDASGSIRGRMKSLYADSRKIFSQAWTLPPEVVYLDPMFPPGYLSRGAPKKPHVFLRRWNAFLSNAVKEPILKESEISDADWVAAACQLAQRKVVIKRPVGSDPLGFRKPSYRLMGKRIAFDVYVTE